MKSRYGLLAAAFGISCVSGCADDDAGAADTDVGTSTSESDGGVSSGGSSTQPRDPETGADASSTSEGPASSAGSCQYTSPFTMGAECRDFVGAGWTEADVQAGCDQLGGEARIGEACASNGSLGRCITDEGTDEELHIVSYGDDAAACSDQEFGCETFAGGTWEPEPICAGETDDDPPAPANVFIPPTLECRDAIDGEPAGDGPDGQVCTWQAISAATEQGRRFSDYASCEVVLTQRPYYPAPPNESIPAEDARLDDDAYVAELDWVREQVESSACICCHAQSEVEFPSNWYTDAEGNWMHTFNDSGLAMAAGWIDSSAFGAYPPQENNGFDRDEVGIPSSDPSRMQAFLEAELAWRGLAQADFADAVPFGGPLHEQRVYEPGRCENGEGVAADGTLTWTGGSARYVYVLEVGSENPTVPPNLDLPPGTRWRADVDYQDEAVTSGSLRYAEPGSNTQQAYPASGAPDPLTPGEDYYLYVSRDIGIPATRCEFTFEG